MKAKAIENTFRVQDIERMPNGVECVIVAGCTYDTLCAFPAGIEVAGKAYGWTGWDSDRNVAYYRSDKRFATKAA